jgi:hypothetical protein
MRQPVPMSEPRLPTHSLVLKNQQETGSTADAAFAVHMHPLSDADQALAVVNFGVPAVRWRRSRSDTHGTVNFVAALGESARNSGRGSANTVGVKRQWDSRARIARLGLSAHFWTRPAGGSLVDEAARRQCSIPVAELVKAGAATTVRSRAR